MTHFVFDVRKVREEEARSGAGSSSSTMTSRRLFCTRLARIGFATFLTPRHSISGSNASTSTISGSVGIKTKSERVFDQVMGSKTTFTMRSVGNPWFRMAVHVICFAILSFILRLRDQGCPCDHVFQHNRSIFSPFRSCPNSIVQYIYQQSPLPVRRPRNSEQRHPRFLVRFPGGHDQKIMCSRKLLDNRTKRDLV